MFKLTTSSFAALFSIFGFGYSFSEYTELDAVKVEKAKEVQETPASVKLIKSPLIKINGKKLLDCEQNLEECAVEQILNLQ